MLENINSISITDQLLLKSEGVKSSEVINTDLIEKNEKLGKKLYITGKGRCNVTNDCSGQEVLQNTPRNGRFLYSAMDAFPPEKIISFFGAYSEKSHRN